MFIDEDHVGVRESEVDLRDDDPGSDMRKMPVRRQIVSCASASRILRKATTTPRCRSHISGTRVETALSIAEPMSLFGEQRLISWLEYL